MPPIPKPIFKPEWATIIGVYGGRTNAIEPPAGRKPEGWLYQEKPPRNYLNWLHHYTGEWIDYLEAMTGAGKMPATAVIAAINASDQWRQSADLVLQVGDNEALLISNLIAALPAGGRILFSDGTFTLTQPIVVTGLGLVIQGQGPSTRFRLEYPIAGGIFAFEAANQYGLRYLDFEIESDLGVAGSTYSNGIHLDQCYSVIIQRVMTRNLHGGPSVHGPNTAQGVAVFAEFSQVSIVDCDLSPTSLAATQSGECVWEETSEVLIDGCKFVDDAWGGGSVAPSSATVYLGGGSKIKVDNCSMTHMDFGIYADRAANAVLSSCHIQDMTTGGIRVGIGDSIQIVDVDIYNAGTYGIDFDSMTSLCCIRGGCIENCPTGLQMAGDSNDVHGLRISDVTTGVLVADALGTAEKNSFNDCRIYTVGGAGSKGFNLAATSAHTTINGGYVAVAEVGIDDFAYDNLINGVKFELCTLAAVRVDEFAGYSIYSNCYVGAGATNGFDLDGDCCNIIGNWIRGATSSLILIRVSGSDNVIALNHGPVTNSAIYGINQDGLGGATRNYIQSNRMPGVGTTADLRIQGALTNAISTPETAGGIADGHDVRDNNRINTFTVV